MRAFVYVRGSDNKVISALNANRLAATEKDARNGEMLAANANKIYECSYEYSGVELY